MTKMASQSPTQAMSTAMAWMIWLSVLRPAPSNLRVSTPPPPSTRARLPAPVCSSALMLLAKIETENGITYDIYTHSDANIDAKAALWVQQGVSMKDMQRGFVINGETADDLVGMSVSSAGDVNGDGLDDLVIGVNDDSNKEGKAYVIFGKQDGTETELPL
jgi:hypothetical protein